MIERNIRGGWRLWKTLGARGRLNYIVRYIFDGPYGETPLYTPIFRPESSMSKHEIEDYPSELVECALGHVDRLGLPFDLIDCGADIGIVSAAFVCAAPLLESVVAFEPNAEAFSYLERSMKEWRVPARAVNKAVGERRSRGRLMKLKEEHDAHACYMEYDASGPIEIECLDDAALATDKTIVLKLDIEGGEHAALAGARKLLSAAPAFVVIFEAHPLTAKRVNIDPCETIALIKSIAPVEVEIAEYRDISVNPSKPFFDQLGNVSRLICNIVCASKSVRR